MRGTGVKATLEELANIQELAETARTTPVIALTMKDGMEGRDFASLAWKRCHKAVQEAALGHGLPEIEGYYGLAEDGEFLTM